MYKFPQKYRIKLCATAIACSIFAFPLTPHAYSNETIYASNGKAMFDVRFFDEKEIVYTDSEHTAKVSYYTFNEVQKQGIRDGLQYWADIFAMNASNSLPLTVFVCGDKDQNAYAMAIKRQENGLYKPKIGFGNSIIDDNTNAFAADISIGQYLGEKNTDNYGWAILPNTQLALNHWQADLVATVRHELGHALGIAANTEDDEFSGTTLYKFTDNLGSWDTHLRNAAGEAPLAGALIATSKADAIAKAQLLLENGKISSDQYQETVDHAFIVDKPDSGMGGNLYFTGQHVDEVINGALLGEYQVPGIPVNAWEGDSAEFSHLNLGMMSHIPYCNYTTFTEADLAIMQDLGYKIDRRNYFGYSIYNSGITMTNTHPYFSRNSEGSDYIANTYNQTPLGLGLHIYGSNNIVTQSADILTEGIGAIGIRVDGSNNKLAIADGTKVHANGSAGIGLLVSYGKNQFIEQNGELEASGTNGIGARFDFGSSSNGWADEYRGSYICFNRVKDGNKLLNKNPELVGPMVRSFNVSGRLAGSRAAIYIGTNAYVNEININQGASLVGDIVSRWNPNLALDVLAEDGSIIDSKLPVVQYDGDNNTLTTNLNFYAANLAYRGNIDSRVGNVDGSLETDTASSNITKTFNLNLKNGASLFYHGTADVLTTTIDSGADLAVYRAVFNSDFNNKGTIRSLFADGEAGYFQVNGKFVNSGNIGLTSNGLQSFPIDVVGSALLSSGSTLIASKGSIYLPNMPYPFLTATDGIIGNVENSANSAFTGLLDFSSAQRGTATLSLAVDTTRLGLLSQSQQDSWRALKRISLNPELDRTSAGKILSLDAHDASAALTQLAGGVQMNLASIIQSNSMAASAISSRLSQANKIVDGVIPVKVHGVDDTDFKAEVEIPVSIDGEFTWWFKPIKSWGKINDGFSDLHSSAFVIGTDRKYGLNHRTGIFFAYGKNTLSSSDTWAKNRDYRFGIYNNYHKEADDIQFYLDYGTQKNEVTRLISDMRADSDYHSHTLELGAEYTHDFDYDTDKTWHKNGFIGLHAVRYNQAAYTEYGSIGVLGQQAESMNDTSVSAKTGIAFTRDFANGGSSALQIGYKHVFTGTDPQMKFSYIGDDATYTARGNGTDKDFLVLGVNGNFPIDSNWVADLDV